MSAECISEVHNAIAAQWAAIELEVFANKGKSWKELYF